MTLDEARCLLDWLEAQRQRDYDSYQAEHAYLCACYSIMRKQMEPFEKAENIESFLLKVLENYSLKDILEGNTHGL